MKNNYKKEVYTSLALISQLGIHVMVPMIGCTLIGVFIDNKFETFLTIPFLIIGVLSGGRNAYVLAKKANVKTEGEKRSIKEQEIVEAAIESYRRVNEEQRGECDNASFESYDENKK